MTTSPSTIVVTRSEDDDGQLTRLLRDAGQNVRHWPVTAIVPPVDINPLRDALDNLHTYDWIVFSSAAAVEAVLGIRAAPPTSTRVAAVGLATATALRRAAWPVDLMPTQAGAEQLTIALLAQSHKAQRVLFPASEIALPTLTEALSKADFVVDQFQAYRVVNIAGGAETWLSDLHNGAVDAVTFTSPSAVTGLRAALGDTAFAKLNGLVLAAIGGTTAAALQENGLSATTVAPRSTLEDLAAATVKALAEIRR